MRLLRKEVPLNFNIFLVSDDHEGSVFRYAKGWTRMCDMVNSDWNGVMSRNNFVVDGGDFMEAIAVDDYRYGPETPAEKIPLLQVDGAVKNREPIKTHIVTILEGNHPWKLWKFGMLTPYLCDRLGVEYGTWSCKIAWVNKGKVLFKSFHRHGSKSITSTADDPRRRKANKELILKRHLKEAAGDTLLMCKSHTHQLLVCPPEPPLYMADDGNRIRAGYAEAQPNAEYIHPDLRWYVNTGSFLRLYNLKARLPSQFGGEIPASGYAERMEYDPTELGFAIVEVRGGRIAEIRKVRLSAGQAGRRLEVDIDPPV